MGCLPNYSRREWLLVASLMGVTLSSSLTASLQAPFYPQEAEKKGATATEYGLVFGIFELVSFLSCPILGKNMGKLGAGFVLKVGVLVTGMSTIAFGLLDIIEEHWPFLTLSFIIRSVEAFGSSAIITASMSIVVVVFEDSFARVFTILEILQGLGYMIGPTVGGYLFEVGGFIMPFGAVGGFVLIGGFFIFVTLPRVDDDSMKDKPKIQIVTVLKLLPVLLDATCLLVQAMSIGFLAATLEPHLRQFHLSPTILGVMFVISGAVYTAVAPLVGVLCDRHFNTKKMILLGSGINIASMMLIGPFPFLPFDTTMPVVIVGLVLDGFGMSFMFVPAFVDAINSAIAYGLPDDINTYAVVSGIYGSAFALGAFIGPSVAGMLFDAVGFRQGSLFVIAVLAILFFIVFWFITYEDTYRRKYGIVTDEENAHPRQPDVKRDSLVIETEGKSETLDRKSDALLPNGCTVDFKNCVNRTDMNGGVNHADKRYSNLDASLVHSSERHPLNE